MVERSQDELGGLFVQCLKFFSTQEPEDFLSDVNSFFTLTEAGWRVNRSHPFWTAFPDATWAMRGLADEFLLQIQRVPDRPKTADWQEIYRAIDHRLQDQMCALVRGVELDVITAISGERYESRDGIDLSMTLVPYPLTEKNLAPYKAIILKKHSWIRLKLANVHALRKQLNLSQGASLAVCYFTGDSIKEEGLYMVGLIPDASQIPFPRIFYTGHMEWELRFPMALYGKSCFKETESRSMRCVLRYHQGRQMLPVLSTVAIDKATVDWVLAYKSQKTRNRISKLIQCARFLRGGAVLVFAESKRVQAESDRLCGKSKRGIELDSVVAFQNNPAFLSQATSVDGAILISFDCRCYAYGVILDGTAQAEGDPSRGARYNSTMNYVENLKQRYPKEDVLGVVISEDGMVDLFPRMVLPQLGDSETALKNSL